MKNLMRRSSIVAVLISLLMVSLTACSSAKTVEETKVSETVEVKEEATEVETEVAEIESETTAEPTPEPTAEPTPEPTAEPTPEPIVYEGIDMESTLPGAEWIATFDGIITEPKVVVLNDETGKKQIVEDGDKVTFNPDSDYMAVYLPGDAEIADHTDGISIEYVKVGENYNLIYLDAEKTRERRRQAAAIYVNFNGEEIKLPFDFIPE